MKTIYWFASRQQEAELQYLKCQQDQPDKKQNGKNRCHVGSVVTYSYHTISQSAEPLRLFLTKLTSLSSNSR